jgi:hypothetical protein
MQVKEFRDFLGDLLISCHFLDHHRITENFRTESLTLIKKTPTAWRLRVGKFCKESIIGKSVHLPTGQSQFGAAYIIAICNELSRPNSSASTQSSIRSRQPAALAPLRRNARRLIPTESVDKEWISA